MNAASMFVTVGANTHDFEHGMTRVEKAAKKGFGEIGEAALKMTEMFSIEFGLAIGEFAHLAAEAQDTGARMDRVFGGAAAEMKEQLERLTTTIPATVAELQNLAVQSDNMLQGLGYGAQKAAEMSVEMVKLAGDMAAFARVPIADAMSALDRGLAGKTRGLLQFGIAIKETEIHQEALRRGWVDGHRTLTQLGTAEIMEYLIREKSARITGEAARTAGQASNSFRFLKASAEEAGVSLGNIVLPAVTAVVLAAKSMTESVEHASDGLKKAALVIGGIGAGVPVAVLGLSKLASGMMILSRAAALAAEGGGAAAVIGGIAAAPFSAAIAGLAALAFAFEAVRGAMQGFRAIGELIWGASDNDEADAVERTGDAQRMAAIRALHEKLAKKREKAGEKSIDSRKPIEIFKERASFAEGSFATSMQMGDGVTSAMKFMQNVGVEATNAMAENLAKGTFEAKLAALEYQKIAISIQQAVNAFDVGQRAVDGGMGRHLTAASNFSKSDDEIQRDFGQSLISADVALRVREFAVAVNAIEDTFQLVRESAVQLAERFRNVDRDFGVTLEQFKSQWSGKSNIAQSAASGLKEGAMQIMQMFTPAALAAQALGKVFQGFQPIIDSLMGPFVALGQIVAIIAKPVMLPLFQALKLLGIGAALVGEVFYTVAAGVAHVIGGLIVAIGKFISHIPFLGGVGADIVAFGQGILNAGKSMTETAANLDTARRQLQDLSFDDAANGITGLTKATIAATSAMLNVPSGYKVLLDRFNATTPSAIGSQFFGGNTNTRGNGGSSASRSVSEDTPIQFVLDGKVLASSTLKALRKRAGQDFANTTLWSQVQTV